MLATVRSQHAVRPTGCCLLWAPVDLTGSFATQVRRWGWWHLFILWGGGGQKSSNFIKTSFIGLLLVCSWGCASSWDILRRQIYIFRLGKVRNGELVTLTKGRLQIAYQLQVCVCVCIYICIYAHLCIWCTVKIDYPSLKMCHLQDWLLEWPLLSSTDHSDVNGILCLSDSEQGLVTSLQKPCLFPPALPSRQFTFMDIISTLNAYKRWMP